jgi:hypothetical protein
VSRDRESREVNSKSKDRERERESERERGKQRIIKPKNRDRVLYRNIIVIHQDRENIDRERA